MQKTWLRKTCLVAVGVISAGMLITGCFPGTAATLPLSLNLDSENATMDETITLTLDNPQGYSLFLPAVWTGIAFYRKLPSGYWAEYSYPDGYQPMFTTEDKRIIYSIPAGFLESGSYKIVIQGRKGSDGIPFTLDANLEVKTMGIMEGEIF